MGSETKLVAQRVVSDYLYSPSSTDMRIWVRVNTDVATLLSDLDHVIAPGLEAVMLPAAESPDAVRWLDGQLCDRERRRRMDAGVVRIVPLIETARGFGRVDDICRSSARIRAVATSVSPEGDTARSVGYRLYADSSNLQPLLSSVQVGARAADVAESYVYCGRDEGEGSLIAPILRRAAATGFTGAMLTHPGPLNLVRRTFQPSQSELTRAEEVVTAFENALIAGRRQAFVHDRVIDEGDVRAARAVLARIRRHGECSGESQ